MRGSWGVTNVQSVRAYIPFSEKVYEKDACISIKTHMHVVELKGEADA